MNTDTGKIYTPEEMKAFDELLKGIPTQSDFRLSDYTAKEMTEAKQDGKLIEMKVAPTDDQLKRGKVGRNEMCPCGSGIKFKRCHWTGRYGQ